MDLAIFKDRAKIKARKIANWARNISDVRYINAPRHIKLHRYLGNNNILPRAHRAQLVEKIAASLPAEAQQQEREYHAQLLDACPTTLTVDPQMGAARLDIQDQPAPACIADTHARIEHFIAGAGMQMNTKPYLAETSSLKDYAPDNPCFQLATAPYILGAVARYFGSCPVLWNITAMYSPPPISNTNKLKGSQLWHIDREDITTLKLWLLCSEITPANGPTIILPTRYSDQVAEKLGPVSSEKVRDEALFEPFCPHFLSLTGNSGDMFLTDTARCYHHGSRMQAGIERRVLMIHYTTRHSTYLAPGNKRAHDRLHAQVRQAWDTLPQSTRAVLRVYDQQAS
ncbi:hypothetical protein [Nitrosomonas sp. ANs5]|uniref:hypothetical protein n=1 Tax=Nitrosomonas sp. ANs5 TaxID=3423941 RepID=UPI003D331CB0